VSVRSQPSGSLAVLAAVVLAGVMGLAWRQSAHAAAEQYCRGEQLVQGANWSLCWETRALEGLALTHAFFVKDGVERRVLSDATLAQVFVPYESGQPRYHEVAYGLGLNLQDLEAAGDCPGGALLAGGKVCSQIVDTGPAERYCASGNCVSRRGSAVSLWSSAQMGTANYVIRWLLKDDGTIEPALGVGGAPMIGEGAHLHNAFWRLDVDVDGPENDAVEEFYRLSPGYADGTVGVSGWTPLLRETYRPDDLGTFRKWRVTDTRNKNARDLATSYELVPSPGDGSLRTTEDEGYMRGELWVTRNNAQERYVSTDSADLLSAYVNGEEIQGADVVLWYAMHAYHEPRSEDRELSPMEWMSFQLRPRDFFDANPGAD
jgi:primary-amine oxidase